MDATFLLIAGMTLISSYLSLRSPGVVALLFFVTSVFGMIISFIIAPTVLQTVVLLIGLYWIYKLWRTSPKLI